MGRLSAVMKHAAGPLKSCIYRGMVQHARYLPHVHRFQYQLFMMYLDLDELDVVFRNQWAWSTRWPTLAWFRRKDHLGNPKVPLIQSVRELVHTETGITVNGPIRLLTQLRYFGYVMNPVSYFYCFNENGSELQAIVAEINNTPWGERHCYVIPQNHASPGNDAMSIRHEHPKDFHVSPFMPMQLRYQWDFSVSDRDLSVSVGLLNEEGRVFDARLFLERKPIPASNLMQTLLRFPCMTASVITAIYWQAFRLWLKKTPYYPHPKSEIERIKTQSSPV